MLLTLCQSSRAPNSHQMRIVHTTLLFSFVCIQEKKKQNNSPRKCDIIKPAMQTFGLLMPCYFHKKKILEQIVNCQVSRAPWRAIGETKMRTCKTIPIIYKQSCPSFVSFTAKPLSWYVRTRENTYLLHSSYTALMVFIFWEWLEFCNSLHD